MSRVVRMHQMLMHHVSKIKRRVRAFDALYGRCQVARMKHTRSSTRRPTTRTPHWEPFNRKSALHTTSSRSSRSWRRTEAPPSASDSGLGLPARHGQNDYEIAVGRSNWLFAGSLRAGQRAAAVMSLIQSAKLNGHDPYAYLKDVFTRLPTQPASRIDELLPHRWQPTVGV